MAPLKVSMAVWDYDRVKAIEDGRVQVQGCEVNFFNLRVEETFYRQLRFGDFDVSELSLSSYLLHLERPDPNFIAIPVFPSRFFRHQSIYINTKSGIKTPKDLQGKRIGVPEFQMTAPVWQRGIMESEYGVPYESPSYFTGALEPSKVKRDEKIPLKLPPNVKVQAIPQEKCLSQMLEDGEIDALYTATQPTSFDRCDHVQHLFPNFKQVEKEYYQKTKIFPIMHIIAIKRSVLKENPWLAGSLVKAFGQSLEIAYDAINERGALRYMLPWLQDHVAETKVAFGNDEHWWKDGLENNKHVIEQFIEYSYRQGLLKKKWAVEEIFASSSTSSFVL